MTLTTDELRSVAVRCGIAVPEWLLTPDGRDAMESAMLANGYDLDVYATRVGWKVVIVGSDQYDIAAGIARTAAEASR